MKKILIAFFLGSSLSAFAQDDLFKMMDSSKTNTQETDYTTATFKSTRVIQGPSIETIGKGNLDFRILHRFSPIGGGAYTMYGIDGPATVRIGLDYGITNRLMVGLGRNTYDKEFDGFVKYKLFRQSEGKKAFPVSITYTGTAYIITDDNTIKNQKLTSASDKWNFSHSLSIARKFNDYFSLQLTPTLVHYNRTPNYVGNVDTSLSKNDFFSLGIAGRLRISKRVNITWEYYHQFNQISGMQNPLSIGFDIETGGHVFQLHFTNTVGMTERTFITQTNNKFFETQGLRFGFNITRIFALKKSNNW